MRHNGLTQKFASLIKKFYKRFECGVILKEGVLDFFKLQTGVRKRHKNSQLGSSGGMKSEISSGRGKNHDDFDEGYDLVVFASTQAQIRDNIDKVH